MSRRLLLASFLLGACTTDPTPVDRAPIVADQDVTTLEDTPVWFEVPAADPEGEPVTLIITAPEHGVLIASGAGWVYEPDVEWSGLDRVGVRVDDGAHTVRATVTLQVVSVNDRPAARGDRLSTAEDTPLVIAWGTLTDNDLDADAQPLTIVGVGAAEGGTAVLADGEIRFTPVAEMSGTARFRYAVSDGEVQDTATVEIEVGARNDVPVARTVQAVTDEDVAVEVKLDGRDVDSLALTYEVVDAPAHGRLEVVGETVTYLPDADYHGTDRFTYVVSDGEALSAPGVAVVTVNRVAECGDLEIEAFHAQAVELRWLATACDGPNELVFRAGGVEVLRTAADDGGCTCYPGVNHVTLTDPAVLALFDGDVDLEVAVAGRTLLAWARVVVHDAVAERAIPIFDHDGPTAGVAEPDDLCAAGSTEDGTGWTRATLGERCDDGNHVGGDGCSATCALE